MYRSSSSLNQPARHKVQSSLGHRNTVMYANWLIVVALLYGTSKGYRDPALKSRIGLQNIRRHAHKLTRATGTMEPPSTEAPYIDNLKPVNERYPHAVLFGHICGGTIIHPRWILTAGHCTLQAGVGQIMAGTSKTNDSDAVVRSVKRQIIHPLFTIGPYWLNPDEFNIKQVAARYDFLLVELSHPLPLDGKKIAVAELYEQSCVPVGLNVSYAGYGSTHFKGYMRNEMHETELIVQSNKACSLLQQYDKQDMLCASGRPPNFDSACNGDSGSGLVDDHGRLIGVLSWAANDAIECSRGALVVFSRVSKVREWINRVVNLH